MQLEQFDDATPLFAVELCECPDLPEALRLKAQARYALTLERQLGSAEAVCQALRTLEQLEEAAPEDITDEAKQTYHRWSKAARAAAESGLQGLALEEGSYFTVHAHA